MDFVISHIELIAASLGLPLALLAIVKFIHHVFSSNRTLTLKSLDLLLTSLSDTKNLASNLTVEQVFLKQFKLKTSVNIIKILMSHYSPSESIELFKESERYLMEKDGQLIFKEKYADAKRRKLEPFLRPIKNYFSYFIFAFIGGALAYITYNAFDPTLAFETTYKTFNFVWAMLGITFSLLSFSIAIKFLIKIENIKSAEKLVNIT